MSVNTTTFANDNLNAIGKDMEQMIKVLETPLEKPFGAPASEYGNSSDNFLSRYLEQHATPVDLETGFVVLNTQPPKHINFDVDQLVGANFIQHHNLHSVVRKNPFVYFTHPGQELEGVAYIPCSLIPKSHLFDVEAVQRDGVCTLLSEEQYAEYLKSQSSLGYCPQSFPPPSLSACLQPVDTTVSTGLSWEHPGSNLSGVPRAINEDVTVNPRALCLSPDTTATTLSLPTYVSAFGTGMDLNRDYEGLCQEEDSDYDLWTFTVSNGETSYPEDRMKGDGSIGSHLACGQGFEPSFTPSARRPSVKSVLKKSQAHRKKFSNSRKHSLPSITKSPLYPPNDLSDISPYGLRATRNITAKMNAIFQESLSASL
ncbi:hypothetical protein DFS33DRAFT_677440 [Desarmillaria ectypa]|nr:hypothetical protein DFS33DRAFT_677440 [Desarmillaria ectypa]